MRQLWDLRLGRLLGYLYKQVVELVPGLTPRLSALLVGWLRGLPAACSAGPAVCPAGWLADWLPVCPAGWLLGWLPAATTAAAAAGEYKHTQVCKLSCSKKEFCYIDITIYKNLSNVYITFRMVVYMSM